MNLERSILASTIFLSSCSGLAPDNAEKTPAAPVVEINLAGTNPGPVELKITQRDGMVKRAANRDNPIIERQQKLWDCITQVDGTLLIDCMEDIVASANCYNAGVEKIVDANADIKACRQARDARGNNANQEEIFDALAKESRCIDVVQTRKPEILKPLNVCFVSEIGCLQREIDQSAIICNLEQEDALLARKK